MKKTSLLLILSLFAVGCRSFEAKTPAEFVDLGHSSTYDYRAASSDGVVLAARSMKNDPRGTLSFYTDVTRRKLREGEGYALVEEREVTSKTGEKGNMLRFGRDHGGTPHLYVVTLFVTNDRIFVLEAGGAKTDVETHAAAIDASVAGFSIK